MPKENIEIENKNPTLTENKFGIILHKLEQLNESYPYYKTLIDHD